MYNGVTSQVYFNSKFKAKTIEKPGLTMPWSQISEDTFFSPALTLTYLGIEERTWLYGSIHCLLEGTTSSERYIKILHE